jgi:hypothetical protein
MNIFVKLIKLSEFTFKKVNYYSVIFEEKDYDEENCEFYYFLKRMSQKTEYDDDLSNLLVCIEEIGNNYGAKEKYFRQEAIDADVSALPPKYCHQKVANIEVHDLRLYCLVANEHVVFLFNGDVKTTLKAQDCPNVGKYIKQANNLVKGINKHFNEDIKWNNDQTDIIYNPDFEFEI